MSIPNATISPPPPQPPPLLCSRVRWEFPMEYLSGEVDMYSEISLLYLCYVLVE